MNEPERIDLFVIGGGINGAGMARDAAGRGLKVVLCEKDDLAEGTSSRSGKLVHGGLRYLEYYEFRLVREALIEREVLLNAAPHIIWPMRFVLPHSPEDRPAWLVRLGLFLYDHLDWHMTLPKSVAVDLQNSKFGAGLKPGFAYGATDEIGLRAVENRVHWHDFHATILHLLGIDHERLTFYHNGIRRRLTDVEGHVVHGILA